MSAHALAAPFFGKRDPVTDQVTLPPRVAGDERAETLRDVETILDDSTIVRTDAEAEHVDTVVHAEVSQHDEEADGAVEMAAEPAPRQRSGRWFPAVCALVAVLAAVFALAAPILRPAIIRTANTWLGQQNAVGRFFGPPDDLQQRIATASEEAMQSLTARLADYDARIDRLAAAQQATATDLSRTLADMKGGNSSTETLARTVDRLSHQTEELGSAVTAMDGRLRAASLLSLSLRLRRDIDAGQPIERDLSALEAVGPYPAAIEHAVQELQRFPDGVPTMSDLGGEFDSLATRLSARSDAQSSWIGRGWSRLGTMLGGETTIGGGLSIDRLRALAADGRFTEVANEIAGSDNLSAGAEWVARVRARATAVVATQAVLGYALAAHDSAYAAQAAASGGKLTQ